MESAPTPEPLEPNVRVALWGSAFMLFMCGALVASIVFWSKQHSENNTGSLQLPPKHVIHKATNIPSCLALMENVMSSGESLQPWRGDGGGMFHWEINTGEMVAPLCDAPY